MREKWMHEKQEGERIGRFSFRSVSASSRASQNKQTIHNQTDLSIIKGTVSRVAHARLSASRSTHAVISRHYRYGFWRR